MSLFKKKEQGLPQNRRRQKSKPQKIPRLKTHLGTMGRRTAELCVIIASIIGLVILGRWTHHYVTTSSYFGAEEAQVTGNQRVSAQEIQVLSGLEPGTNIFAVSTTEAARRITEHPWIRTAKVRRRLPSSITIEVEEREAIALLRVGSLFLVDTEGLVFKRHEAGDPVDLPMITGVDRERYEEARPGAQADLEEALALLRLYEESGLSNRYQLSEIHLGQDGALSIYTVEQATHIRLGRPPFRRKLQRLARLMRELRNERSVADYVYLEEGDDHVRPDRAIVRLRAN